MEEKKEDVKIEEDETPSENPPEKNDPTGSEPVKNSGEEEKKPTADELLDKKPNERRVDEKRFNELNEKAKLVDLYAPIIDKIKGDPEAVKRLLGEEKEPDAIEKRLVALEEERKTAQRLEMREAVTEALEIYDGFEKDWEEIREQVTLFMRRGLKAKDAIRRSYLSLHPESAEKEMQRIAAENANIQGKKQISPSGRPSILDQKEKPNLSDDERAVSKLLIGRQFVGKVLFKTEEDYANALRKNEAKLRERGYYNI